MTAARQKALTRLQITVEPGLRREIEDAAARNGASVQDT